MRWDETSGLFWLSGQEDEKMQGTLKTNDVGALELVTEERFHPLHDPNADSPRNNQLVIHGQSGSKPNQAAPMYPDKRHPGSSGSQLV